MEKSAAVITIKDAASMTEQGRRDVAAWLRRHADMLVKHGAIYSGTFRGRYMYADSRKR